MTPFSAVHTPQTAPHWSTDEGYVRMMIRDLVTEVRLGLHPWERHPEKPQRIVINVEMYAAPQRCCRYSHKSNRRQCGAR